jgi:spore coat polysaccharide biosynthesis protein SpsF
MRWVVDEAADYKFIAEVYKRLYREGKIFYMDSILNLLSKHPELSDINNNIKRNEGYQKSLLKDKMDSRA